MQTNDLIDHLAAGLRPAPSRTRWFGMTIAVGCLIALGLVGAIFGFRPDLAEAVFTSSFWVKWGFTLLTTTGTFLLCVHLARPEGRPGWWPVVLLGPLLAVTTYACLHMVSVPEGERSMIWVGHTAVQCLWCIAILALPLLFGALWAFRRFAPTRLRLAGFSAGLLAGSATAVVYALHCEETAPAFVAIWYSLGMILPALLGLAIGPRVLRW